ncbi:MAG: GAF domain-containing protein [Myxococcales bacterium]|nr:GAF domain-containing protein [Myxococcales bacterium]
MSIQSLSALLAAILTFVIGWSVILRDRAHRQYVTFTALCFNLSFFYLAHFFATTLESSGITVISQFFAIAIPTSTERFFRAFLADDPRHPHPLFKPVVVLTFLFYVALFVSFFFPINKSPWFRVPLFFFVFGSLGYSVTLIYGRLKAIASRPEAVRLKYLLYGGAAALTLAATDFVPRAGVGFPTVGNVLTVIYMYFISQTLFHYRLLDIKELLGKMMTLSVLVLILTVIYGLLLAWVGRDQPGVFFFNTIVASFVILALFEPLRGRVEDRVNRWLFAEKYAFSQRLRRLVSDLANVIEVRSGVGRVLREMEDSARVTHASIYLADPGATRFRLAGHVGPAPIELLDSRTRRLFFERLRDKGYLNRDNLERELADQDAQKLEDAAVVTRNILEALDDQHADLCIPLVLDEQLLGLFNLRDDRLREAYASDEIELLRRVAAQAAVTLRNSQLYEEMKERDRLAALGQMAAGLAHEIRNPLGAIKGAAQLLDPEHASDAEQQEYMGIIVEEVDRLNRVVSQFLGYARPDRGQREPASINDVVRKAVQVVRQQLPESVELDVQLGSELPQVRADPEQMRQVLLNLCLNAVQAMEGRGQLSISTRRRRGFRGGMLAEFVEIAVSDTGRGIAAEALSNIFIPFFTTKEGGTGLGLPICQRIIENHHGTIEVRSHVGKGTVFTVVLPTAADADVTQQVSSDREEAYVVRAPRTQTLRIGELTRVLPAADSPLADASNPGIIKEEVLEGPPERERAEDEPLLIEADSERPDSASRIELEQRS